MKTFRQILFWCHLAVGAIVAVIVVIMSATGVLLTYQKQMTVWADTRGLPSGPPTADAPRLPLDSLLSRVQAATTVAPTGVTVRSGSDAPVEVTLGRDRRAFVNAYTGAVLGEGSANMRAFFRVVTAWHRTLGATAEKRALARSITGAANLGFLFLVVTGLYLWWPRNWSRNALLSVTTFRRRLSGKARDFNWHNVIGFWSFAPLFFVVLSGVVISYPRAGALVYRVVGEKPPAPQPAPAAAQAEARPREGEQRRERESSGPGPSGGVAYVGFDAAVANARERMPDWKAITFQVPRGSAKTLTVSVDGGTGGQPQARASLTVDRATGAETKWEPFSSQTPGRRLRSILRFTHTGEVLGIGGQTVAGLVSLGAVVLAWTGIALAFRRLLAWRRRQARAAAPVPVGGGGGGIRFPRPSVDLGDAVLEGVANERRD